MTTAVNALFIDANILLYSMNSGSPFHQEARRALQHAEEHGIECVISTQILREFYGISSRLGKDGRQVDTAPIPPPMSVAGRSTVQTLSPPC
jgi:predicted nucleic acid-binding protein